MNFFLDNLDTNLNTGLHLASEHGHLSIVNILIDCGIDTNSKNKDGSTPLELSCRKGYFEISKMLIVSYSSHFSQYAAPAAQNENPLHVACFEGAHEVVRLLLLKGVAIDCLNEQKQNCLDIAIQRNHTEVIKVLLQDKNWHKLMSYSATQALVNLKFYL